MSDFSEGGRVPKTCPGGWSRYTVRSGDTMFFIARRFSVSLDRLISANPHISNPDLILAGDVLCVPTKEPDEPRVPEKCPTGWSRYTVRSGDTMFFIARRFSISLDRLIEANRHIANPDVIFPEDVLCVP